MIGRADELQLLLQAAHGEVPGRSAWLVGGDAGVGKTRLVDELAARSDAGRVIVATGACIHTANGSLPYVAISEALRTLCREAALDPDELPNHVRTEISALVPELDAGSGPGADPVTEARTALRLFDAVASLLGRIGADRRVCLVLEDLHWADASTRELFVFLVHNVAPEAVSLVATYRTDEMSRRHPLRPMLVELDRSSRVRHLTLAPFGPAELARFAAARLGEPVTARVLDDLAERSGGNAFFAAELLDARLRGEPGVRPELEDLIVARIEALSRSAQALLQVVAVGGESVRDELLEVVLGGDDERLAAVSEVIDARVVVVGEGGRLRFRHALLQEAIYRTVLPGERRRIHARYAEALTRRPDLAAGVAGASAELAWHHREARAFAEAGRASVAAARASEAIPAFAEALGHVEVVLELWDDLGPADDVIGLRHLELLRWAGALARDSGDFPRAARYFRAAIDEVGDAAPADAAILHERLGRCLQAGGQNEQALRVYERADELAAVEAPEVQAVVSAGLGQQLMLTVRYADAIETLARAVEVARSVGDRRTEGHALNSLGTIQLHDGDHAGGRRQLEQAMAIAATERDAVEHLRGYVNLVSGLKEIGDLDEAARLAREGMRLAVEQGLESSSGFFVGANYFEVLGELGRWSEADAFVAELRRPEGHLPRLWTAHARADRALRSGDLAEAERALDDGELAGGVLDPQLAAEHWVRRAELAFALGDLDAGREAVRHGLDARSVVGQQLALHVLALEEGDSVEAVDAAHHLSEVERLCVGLPDDPGAPIHRLRAFEAEARGLAADDDDTAMAAFTEAVAHWAAGGFAWREARRRLRLGVLLDRGGRTDEARAQWRVALDRLVDCEDATLTAELRGLLEPATPAQQTGAGEGGLTARELDVLRLIAGGWTNGQIGERLFISPKTVSVHVSRILAKLEVENRTAAAAVARRAGLVDDGDGDRNGSRPVP